ncbi:MAG: hypothetical protein MUO21_10090 [Nitrososphaeraceae archaeon]|nr:hypothetical protein [Nitrososphaeraceae archaeon]
MYQDNDSSDEDLANYEEYDGPIPGVCNDPQQLFEQYFGDIIRQNKIKKNTVILEPIRINVELALEEIYSGIEWADEIQRYSYCDDCDGTTYPDGKEHKCKHCNGTGDIVTIKQKGPGSMTQTQTDCSKCNGFGNDNECTKCKNCVNGLKLESFVISHIFEQGTETGELVDLGNIGHQAQKGRIASADRGIVELVVTEIPHEVFKRGVTVNGRFEFQHLALELSIELHEAICGFSREITHLDGSKFYIDSKDIIKDGEMRIIKGRGFPCLGNPNKFGDILVIFKINYPQKFTAAMKSKIYEFLTGQKYSAAKVHKVPKNKKPIDLQSIDSSKRYDYDQSVPIPPLNYDGQDVPDHMDQGCQHQ